MSVSMDVAGNGEPGAAEACGGQGLDGDPPAQGMRASLAPPSPKAPIKRIETLLDGVGRLWPLFVGLVVAVAITGEVLGPQAAAVALSGGSALCLTLVGLAVRLDRVTRGITVLAALALGVVMTAVLTLWTSETIAQPPNHSPSGPAAARVGTTNQRTDLSGSGLRGADLAGAQLVQVDLRGADLRDACLRGANLREAVVDGTDLGGADLRGAVLDGVDTEAASVWPTAAEQERSGACN